jgi:hypothetical protein
MTMQSEKSNKIRVYNFEYVMTWPCIQHVLTTKIDPLWLARSGVLK